MDDRRAQWVWVFLVFAIAIGLYAPTLSHGFVFDDVIVVVRNPLIRSVTSIAQIFSSPEWFGGGLNNHLYRPLTILTYGLNYQLSGLSAWSYHLVNVFLHGAVSVLVFYLGLRWRLSLTAAFLGALVFAVHPIHVEAVANIVGRKELLATAFILTMVLSHARSVSRGGVSLAVPVSAYMAAMFSKEIGVIGIGLVLMQDLLVEGPEFRRRHQRRLALLYATYLSALIGYVAIRWSAVGGIGVPTVPFVDNPAAHGTVLERVMTAVVVFGKGLILQVLPVGQSPDYSYNSIAVVRAADARFVTTLVVIFAACVLAVRQRRIVPALALAASWYFFGLLPGSNLLYPVGTLFGERLLYLPSVGFCLVVGLLLGMLQRRSPVWVLQPLAFAVIALLSGLTLRYAQAWSSDLKLFSVAVANVPDSGKAHQKLAEALLDSGHTLEAMEEARHALAISPEYYRASVVLADAYLKLGKLDKAEQEYNRALSKHGSDEVALYALGKLRIAQGRHQEAEEIWERVLALNPSHAGSLSDLGTLNFMVGDTVNAVDYWERAVQADPSMGSAWYNLGLLYEARGDRGRARAAYRAFLQVALPEYAPQIERARAYVNGN